MLNPEIEIQILNESEMLNRMVKSYKTYVLFTPIILTNSKSYPRIVEMFSRIEYPKGTSLDFAKNYFISQFIFYTKSKRRLYHSILNWN